VNTRYKTLKALARSKNDQEREGRHVNLEFIKALRWIPPARWGEESGDSPQANQLIVCTGYMRNNLINVGDELRRYEKTDVASYLVYDVATDATKLYMKL